MDNLSKLEDGSLKGQIEALLLVSSEAVTAKTLAHALGVAPAEATQALRELSQEYQEANRGFQLREVAGGWRLFTHPAYHDQVQSFVMSWDHRKLSQASLETLAIIAYQQPISREGVRAVRGVSSDGVIASLREKGLVHVVGKDANQATLFGTTTAFLEGFGLRSLADLPPLEDFAPDEETKKFIRERLSSSNTGSTPAEAAEELDEDQEFLEEGDGDAE